MIKYNYKNRIVEKSFEGYNINDELIKDINKINNDTITFTFLIEGQGGVVKHMIPIKVKLK